MLSEETKNVDVAAKTEVSGWKRITGFLLKCAAVLASISLTAVLLGYMVMNVGSGTASAAGGASDPAIMDKFDMFLTNEISNALEGVLSIEKVYWLSDSDQVAPEPNPACYGTAQTPAELMWLLDEAAALLDGQEMMFNENVPLWEHGKIEYYYDETILVIAWQQLMDGIVHNIAEVKIADPSQFRRGLAGGEFGYDKQFMPTQIAQSVNAVIATSGDFYKFRMNGIIVYEGKLRRFDGQSVDTCFIDDKANLVFAKRGEISSVSEAEKYIADNHVRFSLAFGPVLVEDGKNVVPDTYPLGEINEDYTRASVCQLGELHYMFVNTSSYPQYGLDKRENLNQFADNLIELGVNKAYALDGGQTTVIAMDGELFSAVDYGFQRQISDIIYFATALPDGE